MLAMITPMPSKPKPMRLSFGDLPDLSEYSELAKALEFRPPQIDGQKIEAKRRELIGFMLDCGMPIYSNDDVKSYMDKLIKRKNRQGVKDRWGDKMRLRWDWKRLQDYRHPIPIDMLRRASAIKKQYPTAEFSITDYEVVNPDPFISVSIAGCEKVVFGVWDEPGFGAIGRDRK